MGSGWLSYGAFKGALEKVLAGPTDGWAAVKSMRHLGRRLKQLSFGLNPGFLT